jgi:phage shock protein PspC (stress-responsive transcriptional regulator)
MDTDTRREQAPPPPPGGLRPPLRRTDRRYIAGVAGGLAEHFDIDVTVVRIVFLVLCVFGGAGIAAYGAGWLMMPDSLGRSGLDELPGLRNPAVLAAAVVVLLVALWAPWWHFGRLLGPAVLVVAGVLLLVNASRRGGPSSPPPPNDPVRAGSPPPPPPTSPVRPEETAPTSRTDQHTTQQFAAPASPPPAPPPPGPVASPPPAPRGHLRLRAPWVTVATLGLMCAVSGVLALNGVSGGIIVAVDLLLAGAALAAGAWLRRSDGLIAIGALLVAALVLGGAIPVSYGAGTGDRSFRPTGVDQLHTYELFAGQQVVDLRGLDLATGAPAASVRVEQGFGSVEVVVPQGAQVTIASRVRIGEQDLLGRNSSGVGNHEPSMTDTPAGSENGPTIDLDIDLAVGRVEVRRGNA